MRLIHLGCGIGAPEVALKAMDVPLEIVLAVDKDPSAINSYNRIHGTSFPVMDIGDIKDVERYQPIDLLVFGSPCQSFSIAGKREGSLIPTSKSSIMWALPEVAGKILKNNPMLIVVWENVANVACKTFRPEILLLYQKMRDAGFSFINENMLNSAHFDSAQVRKRVYTVFSSFEIHMTRTSLSQVVTTRLIDVVSFDKGEEYRHVGGGFYKTSNGTVLRELPAFLNQNADTTNRAGIVGTFVDDHFKPVTASFADIPAGKVKWEYSKSRRWIKVKEGLRFYSSHMKADIVGGIEGMGSTLTTSGSIRYMWKKDENTLYVRKLTARECWKIMGFPDHVYEKAAEVSSPSALVKQAGNSMCINTIGSVLYDVYSAFLKAKLS